MYKPAIAIIAPDVILIQSEYFIRGLRSIFEVKKAIMRMVNENPPAKIAMLMML